MGVSGQLPSSIFLPPERQAKIIFVQEPGWTPEPVWMLWRRQKNSFSFLDSISGCPALCHTDWSVLAPDVKWSGTIKIVTMRSHILRIFYRQKNCVCSVPYWYNIMIVMLSHVQNIDWMGSATAPGLSWVRRQKKPEFQSLNHVIPQTKPMWINDERNSHDGRMSTGNETSLFFSSCFGNNSLCLHVLIWSCRLLLWSVSLLFVARSEWDKHINHCWLFSCNGWYAW
jgi:hypothetical protein